MQGTGNSSADISGGLSLACFPLRIHLDAANDVVEDVTRESSLGWIADDEATELQNRPNLRTRRRTGDDRRSAHVAGLRAAAERYLSYPSLRRGALRALPYSTAFAVNCGWRRALRSKR